MESYSYLLALAVILISTKVLSIITKKFQMPQVVGALLAGLLIGPAVFGIVQETDERGFVKIYQRNKFSVGEEIEVMVPDGTNRLLKVLAMEDENRQPVESAPHPKQEIWIDFGEPLETGWLLRRKE